MHKRRRLLRGGVFIISVFFCIGFLYAQPEGYYNSAQGKSGENLQSALHDIIDSHTVLSYSSLWSAFQSTDKKSDGTVWDMYSDVPGGSASYVYTFGTDQCGNYSGEGSCYNREHSFPKSWFNNNSPMNTDLFHIYPTDGYVNGKRSNYPFGETDSPAWVSSNGSELGPCSVPGYSGTVFEPIDEYKGDFARTYFYMAVRYYGEDAGWSGSPMVDGSQLEPWAKEMLIQWHENDPVSDKERARNDAVYALQGNRNPFIDQPAYVNMMYSGVCFDETPPDIDSITIADANSVRLWFNEPLDSLNALDADHYRISGDITVSSVTFAPESRSGIDLIVSDLQNGNYAVTISGVSDTAGNFLQLAIFPFSVSFLGAYTDIWIPDISLFPNPGNGDFSLELNESGSAIDQLLLTDITGRNYPVEYERADPQHLEVHSNIKSGSYFLKVIFSGFTPTIIPVLVY